IMHDNFWMQARASWLWGRHSKMSRNWKNWAPCSRPTEADSGLGVSILHDVTQCRVESGKLLVEIAVSGCKCFVRLFPVIGFTGHGGHRLIDVVVDLRPHCCQQRGSEGTAA